MGGKLKVLTKTTKETLEVITKLRLDIEVTHYIKYTSFHSNDSKYNVIFVNGEYLLTITI